MHSAVGPLSDVTPHVVAQEEIAFGTIGNIRRRFLKLVQISKIKLEFQMKPADADHPPPWPDHCSGCGFEAECPRFDHNF